MGSVFARPPALVAGPMGGFAIALAAHEGIPLEEVPLHEAEVLCLGGEREGLPAELLKGEVARLPLRADGPDSLNVAMAATVALYERNRMARHG